MARRDPLSAAKRKREADKRQKQEAKRARRAKRAEERADTRVATESETPTRENDDLEHRVQGLPDRADD